MLKFREKNSKAYNFFRGISIYLYQMQLITTIIPVYNAQTSIEHNINEIADIALSYPDIDFVFVDNGSRDHTAYILYEYIMSLQADNLYMLKLPIPYSKVDLLRLVLKNINSQYITCLELNMLEQLNEIEKILRLIEKEQTEIILGHRINERLNMIDSLCKFLLKRDYIHAPEQLACFRQDIMLNMLDHAHLTDYSTLELVYLADKYKYRIQQYTQEKYPLKMDRSHLLQHVFQIKLSELWDR